MLCVMWCSGAFLPRLLLFAAIIIIIIIVLCCLLCSFNK